MAEIINMPRLSDTMEEGVVAKWLVNIGDKVAQAVLCPVMCGEVVDLINVEKIEDGERSDKGFGSTGI